MPQRRINPKWINDMEEKLYQEKVIDTTQSWLPCIQWLVERLSSVGKAYKIYNLGAGVKRLTTETDTCPCCRRKL